MDCPTHQDGLLLSFQFYTALIFVFQVTYQLYGSRGQCLLEDACYEAGPGLQDGLWLRLQGAAKEAIADSHVKAPKIS